MMHRKSRAWSIPNGEIDYPSKSRWQKLFRHRDNHSSLYFACQNNDLRRVKACLETLKHKQIDHQYAPDQETVLHVATRNQYKDIVQTLLSHGIRRSIRNASGKQAYQLAEMSDIQELFQRSKSSRFAFLPSSGNASVRSWLKSKCRSCSLMNDNTFYEWELIDRNASQIALRFRRELKPLSSMSESDLRQKLYSTKKGYISTRLQDIPTTDRARITEYFQYALDEEEPYYIVTAYTICQSFSELLNRDMARNVIHDLKNGCSKFSCDCLYSTEDGTKSIINIFFHHPKFQKLSFKGEVYRGIVVPKDSLAHYKVGSCIITTTFLSTSKNADVARIFCDKGIANPTTHAFFCIYEILNEEHTALDISGISEFEQEAEVLILPYSAFVITNVEEGEETTKIYLKQQCLSHMFGRQEVIEHSLKSAARLLEIVGSHLLHYKGKTSSSKDESNRPRSKSMPA